MKDRLPDFSEQAVNNTLKNIKLSSSLEENCVNIRAMMNNSTDLIIKYATLKGYKIAVITCEGMIDKMKLADLIYRPLMENPPENCSTANELFNKVASTMLIAEEQRQLYTCDDVLHAAMSGFAVILCDEVKYAIAIGIQGFSHRSIDEPSTHINLRASREGFIEVIRINIAMVRRRMKSPTLKTELMKIGERSNTDICLCYLTDRADEKILLQG